MEVRILSLLYITLFRLRIRCSIHNFFSHLISARSSSAKSYWIKCDDCGKWRKLNLESVFPEAFTCSHDGQKAPYNTCEADLEHGIPATDIQLTGVSDEEVDIDLNLVTCGNILIFRIWYLVQ